MGSFKGLANASVVEIAIVLVSQKLRRADTPSATG